MFSGKRISVVIPCHNEEAGIRAVIERMPRPLVDEVVVVNNASTDRTEEVALALGAIAGLDPAIRAARLAPAMALRSV